uniref:Uncharacterized protein n=1 Tax=Pyxicephalus adspersus TaxID=30357 RepID=A0AAV3AGC9_PYXAD|nr:TPA: hypothetical protein GDO54_011796 [Pyxicephalus adspersus]
MGCSSSTQTHTQGGNRPPAKTVETNGPKKSASEVSDQIIDEIETIPDQTKLVPLTETEPSANGIPPEEEQVEAEEAIEFEGAETLAPTTEDSSEACLPIDQELAQAEEPTEVITSQDSSVVEGEIEEAVEANSHEKIVSEDPETKEDETEHPVDVAGPETDTADVEE